MSALSDLHNVAETLVTMAFSSARARREHEPFISTPAGWELETQSCYDEIRSMAWD